MKLIDHRHGPLADSVIRVADADLTPIRYHYIREMRPLTMEELREAGECAVVGEAASVINGVEVKTFVVEVLLRYTYERKAWTTPMGAQVYECIAGPEFMHYVGGKDAENPAGEEEACHEQRGSSGSSSVRAVAREVVERTQGPLTYDSPHSTGSSDTPTTPES